MPLPITPASAAAIPAIPPISAGQPSTAASFQSVLSDAIGRVEQFQQNSENAIGKYLSGEDEEVHKVALAVEDAETSFDLFLQVRNKVISAYQEVMRMQM
ncbi:MAG: flagellar hook-basal body complex protein FliE [Bryobacteraceae bacterium]|jgi:flagellar hook-basal body complex protein FliE